MSRRQGEPKPDDEKPAERADRLAKGVVKFETRLAKAGLDLYVHSACEEIIRLIFDF